MLLPEKDLRINELTTAHINHYISLRQKEKVKDETINRDLRNRVAYDGQILRQGVLTSFRFRLEPFQKDFKTALVFSPEKFHAINRAAVRLLRETRARESG